MPRIICPSCSAPVAIISPHPMERIAVNGKAQKPARTIEVHPARHTPVAYLETGPETGEVTLRIRCIASGAEVVEPPVVDEPRLCTWTRGDKRCVAPADPLFPGLQRCEGHLERP